MDAAGVGSAPGVFTSGCYEGIQSMRGENLGLHQVVHLRGEVDEVIVTLWVMG